MDGTDVGFLVDLPVIGLLICFLVVVVVLRTIVSGGRFMCMETHHRDSDEIDRLRRELEELREQVKKQRAA
jgi:tetrahydromethanopterin S-methyltransferase subunit G